MTVIIIATITFMGTSVYDSLWTVLQIVSFYYKAPSQVLFICIMEEFKRISLMTVATATKPVAPRKRRTRKVAVKTVKVTTPKVSTPKRPAASKLISPQRYWSDIKTRWSIHNYEITMLLADLTKLNQYVRQFTKWPLRPHRGLFFVII